MISKEFLKAGHAPTLFSAFLYFDMSFMVWVLLGALGVQIAAKVRAQVDIDLKARAQELLALDEQMKAMRDDLVKEQRNTDARVAERTDAVKSGQPIQERGMFGDGGAGSVGGERRGKPRPEQPAATKP